MSSEGFPAAALHRYQDLDSLSFSSYEDSFLHLLKEITRLQWVRESLPSHNKFYEGLRQKERKIKNVIENQFSTTDQDGNTIVDTRMQDNLDRIQEQIAEAENMLDDLMTHKIQLDAVCHDLHNLYNEVVPAISDNPLFANEQTLKREVAHLEHTIPKIEVEIHGYQLAQEQLHQARECLDKAINLLPGASTFLDRKALKSCGIGSSRDAFPSQSTMDVLEASSPTTQDVEQLAQEALYHLTVASEACKDASVLKIPLIDKRIVTGSHKDLMTATNDMTVSTVLMVYNTSKLEIENLLRTQINPHFSQIQTQLTVSKFHYEQKSIEWTLQQITILESVLRENGALRNNSLQNEMAVLRMGSNAAIMAVASEANNRVTVDDVLEVNTSERNGPLPVYSKDAGELSSTSSVTQDHIPPSSSSSSDNTRNPTNSISGNSNSNCSNSDSNNSSNHPQLPEYSTSAEYDGHDQPPAYCL